MPWLTQEHVRDAVKRIFNVDYQDEFLPAFDGRMGFGIFTPPAEEVAYARKVIAAFERPENASRGVIQLDGQMVERLHADMARRTIAIADAIAAMAS